MGETDVIQITRDAIIVLLVISSPLLLVGMGVGLAISLVQALTQIQESTIAFVPKILLMFISLIFLLPFMTQRLMDFTERLQPLIIGAGAN